MKKTIHNIVLSEKENKLVIAALLASNEGSCSKADKNKMWKHLMANIQYLNLEYTIINLYQDNSTDIPAFLIRDNGQADKLLPKLDELKKSYGILDYHIIDKANVINETYRIKFADLEEIYYLRLDDLIDKLYNYYDTYNYLGKMGGANGAKKKWQQMLV